MDNLSSSDIKGYELRERIGTGGFGAVYRAYQSTVGREVAIKFILPGFSNQPDFIRRFETEAQLVARLEHPHITPLYDYWRDPDGAYLVMRWLRGGSLREVLQNGAFDVRSAALLLDQIAGALSLAHRNGVIHRDLKPGNILLDEDGNAYLADFGIAKDLRVEGGNTQPDAIVGSLDYISPEQARSEPVTPRTDIYSLGVVLFEVLAGHHPFESVSAIERLYKHINDPLPELAGLDDSISNGVNQVIQKATAKNPEQRYSDALTMAVDFREAAGLNRTPTGQTVEGLLTQREHEILRLIIDGRSNKEIAQFLTITLGTVKWYVNQIYSKLRVRSRVQAIIRARELNLIGSTNAVVQASSSLSNLPEPENPYKGLLAFQPADAQDFFGRDDLIKKLIRHMENGSAETNFQRSQENDFTRFLAVVGPSGSGKSSLVKAGLIPALWRGELPGSEKWFVVEMLPGAHPLDKLEVALIKVAANQSGSLNEQLARDKRGLLRAADLILPNDGSELVLVIDQFEEVFTLVEDEAERQHFLDLLVAAVRDLRSRVRVVITLRADFYDRPLIYPEFGELVRSRMETVMPLSAKRLERAIAGPAERVGVKFESGLVAALVAEMNYQAGALPLLQYALTELFERREGRTLTHKAYQEIGGAVGALAKRAEELYLDLTPEGQEATRQIFMRLVTLGEGVEDTRRRAARSELLAVTSEADVADEIIDTYATYRLLSLGNDPANHAPTVELAHEAILREWERLRIWLNDSREDIRLQRQLMNLTADWNSAKQDRSFLLRGTRLETFEKWSAETKLALTPAEQTYLQTSLTNREQEQTAEQERQVRETRLEHRSRNFLRGLVAVFAIAAVVALGLSGLAFSERNRAETALGAEQSARSEAENSATYARSIALASAAKSSQLLNNPDQAIALAVAANTTITNPPSLAQSVLYDTAFTPATRKEFTSPDAIGAILSPDGHRALSWSSADTQVTYWDVETGQILRRIPEVVNGELIAEPDFSPNGQTVFISFLTSNGIPTGNIVEISLDTGEEIRRFVGPEGSYLVAPFLISWDGKTLLSSSATKSATDGSLVNSTLYAIDAVTGSVLHQFPPTPITPPYGYVTLTLSADGQQMVTSYTTGLVVLWDINTGKPLHVFKEIPGEIINNFVTKKGLVIISTDPQGKYTTTVTLWDTETGTLLQQQTFPGVGAGAELSPDGHTLALALIAPDVPLFDIDTWQTVRELHGNATAVGSVAFSYDGQSFLSVSTGDFRLWNLTDASQIRQMEGLTTFLGDFVLSPDGHTAVSQEYNGPLTLWDLNTGTEIRHLGETQNSFMGVAFSPDGHYLVSGTSVDSGGTCPNPDGELTLTDVSTGKIVWQTKTSMYAVTSKAFINGGSQIATVDWQCGGNITIWDAATGKQVAEWTGHQGPTWALAVSSDGKWMATASEDGSVILWDVATGSIIHSLHYDVSINKVIFSHDDRYLLTWDDKGVLHLWDIASGQEVRQFIGHTSRGVFMQFSLDDRYILSSGSDNNIFVWDVQTGEVVRQFHLPVVSSLGSVVTFSADGQSLFMTDENNVIHQVGLMLQPGKLLNWIHANRYIPDLTCDQRELYQLEPLCSETTATPSPSS